MTTRIEDLLNRTFDKEQKKFRRNVDWKPLLDRFIAEDVDDETRARMGLEAMLAAEQPVFMEGERIHFLRTVSTIPDLHSEAEMEARRKAGTAFGEKGVVFNLTADFGPLIAEGLDARIAAMSTRLNQAKADGDAEGVNFLNNAILSAQAVLGLVDRYLEVERSAGAADPTGGLGQTTLPAVTMVGRVSPRPPLHAVHTGAKTFHEALQVLRVLHFAMWCEGEYHCGLGRIDQYLLPYYERDLEAGRLDESTALELLEEFFIACNRDSDLYIGVQQGDNGQSVMLGGVTREGKPAFNALSRLCLKACGELKLVDPKINLRVDKNTPTEVYELGTELTAKGLGFPQYANDDVVIPALQRWGYELEDARDYTCAACWEFIIPGIALDINNIDAVSFAGCLDTALRKVADGAMGTSRPTEVTPTYEDVETAFFAEIKRRADALVEKYRHVEILPGPFVSVMTPGCIERARDIGKGAKYNNFGIHGTGIAVAVDSLAAVKAVCFGGDSADGGGTPSLPEFIKLLDTDFAGRPEVWAAVKAAPKMGNADPETDAIAKRLIDFWGHVFDSQENDRVSPVTGKRGVFRPGTGSAMYYIWHAREIPASPNGRLKGEPLSANYAPSLDTPVKGPVSVVRSFTEPDLQLVANGGPLTIEIHDSAFALPDGIEKVAHLVKFFIDRGGHQMQINTINRETLIDAQAHPEKHRHLIVRVWGWSGYFIELDKEYQDQIIRRVELKVYG